ncbi:MAG: hypothetical protein ACFCAD_12920 [Pleurocapsa sp.]
MTRTESKTPKTESEKQNPKESVDRNPKEPGTRANQQESETAINPDGNADDNSGSTQGFHVESETPKTESKEQFEAIDPDKEERAFQEAPETEKPSFNEEKLVETLDTIATLGGFTPGIGDFVSIGAGIAIFSLQPSWLNLAGLGGDLVGVLPGIPSFGSRIRAISKFDEIASVTTRRLSKSVSEGKTTLSKSKGSGVRNSKAISEIDADAIVEGIREESVFTKRPTKQPRLRRTSGRHAKAARKKFNQLRGRYADRLGVSNGGQVHHAIELQVLDRYPGVFRPSELNDFQNMRGIGRELKGRRQLHNSYIRSAWNRHYRKLDAEIQRQKLQEGTQAYRSYVKKYLSDARDEIDYLIGQFFTEYRTGKPRNFQ